MAFDPEVTRVPTSIGDVRINITDVLVGSDMVKYRIDVLDADGNTIRVADGNLVPHLSASQITELQSLAADVRTKVQALIP